MTRGIDGKSIGIAGQYSREVQGNRVDDQIGFLATRLSDGVVSQVDLQAARDILAAARRDLEAAKSGWGGATKADVKDAKHRAKDAEHLYKHVEHALNDQLKADLPYARAGYPTETATETRYDSSDPTGRAANDARADAERAAYAQGGVRQYVDPLADRRGGFTLGMLMRDTLRGFGQYGYGYGNYNCWRTGLGYQQWFPVNQPMYNAPWGGRRW